MSPLRPDQSGPSLLDETPWETEQTETELKKDETPDVTLTSIRILLSPDCDSFHDGSY